MKCLKKNTIMEYIDNEISGEKLREIEAHLAACPKCGKTVEKMRRDTDLVMKNIELLNPRHVPPVGLFIPQQTAGKTRRNKVFSPAFKWWGWRAAAAAAMLIFVAGIFVGKYFISHPTQGKLVKLESPEHLSFVLQEHFENIKPVLIEYANVNITKETGMDILLDKKFAAALVEQNRIIKKNIPRDKNIYLKQLLDELEVILRKISALTEENRQSLSLIKKLIKEKEILFKLEATVSTSRDFMEI